MPTDPEQAARAQLPIIRVINAYLPLSLSRWMIDLGMKRVKLPSNIAHQAVSADGVPCVWLTPDGSSADRVLIYLHGGGFVFGLTSLHLEMAASLGERMGVRVLMVDYRLAPEHPFPTPLEDCVTAYRWLLKQGIAAANIVMAGDSAGGNLTLASLMLLRDSGDRLPAAAAGLSPVGNFSERAGLLNDTTDPLLHPKAAKFFHKSYVADNDPHNPLLSPVFGDWTGLPPVLIHCGEDEMLREDAVQLTERAQAAGVAVRLEVYPNMWHVWQIFPALPQTHQSLDDIGQFLSTHLASSGAPLTP